MSDLVFEKLTQTLGAGEIWRIGIAGEFFRLDGTSAPVTVTLFKGGRKIGAMTGMQDGDYVRDTPFDTVWIESATPQSVTLQIAGGGVGSDRVVGVVSVIDGGKTRTEVGAAFWGQANVAAAVGSHSHAQIWNPVGSGRRVVIEQFGVASLSGVAGVTGFGMSVAPLLSMISHPASKLSGGAASAAESRSEQNALTQVSYQLGILSVVASGYECIRLSEPIVLNPGAGFVMWRAEVNQDIYANFEFYEEMI